MYQRILVPVDGSEAAALGLNEAIKLARNQSARIRLVHVVNELIIAGPAAAAVNFGTVLDKLRKDGEAFLDAAQSTVRRAGIEVDTALVEAMGGQAGDHVVQQARQWNADLIVCGTHGRRGIRRLLMGSDAEYIVRHSRVPVLLVRNPDQGGT